MGKMRRLAALLLCVVMVFGAVSCTSKTAETGSAGSQQAPAGELSLGAAQEQIYQTASKYRENLTLDEILAELPEKDTGKAASRAEALTMLSSAFGKLPEPVGDAVRRAAGVAEYTDVPDFAKAAIANLNSGLLLVPSEDGLLKPDEVITEKELSIYLRRIWALCGTRPQDDFYAAVNKEWLDTEKLQENEYTAGIFKSLTGVSDAHVEEIIESIVSGDWEKGSPERKIADYYNAFIDSDAQQKTGSAPLKPYLDKLAAAKTMADLEAAYAELVSGAAYLPFLSFAFMEDYMDSTKTAVYLSANLPTVIMADYSEANQTAYAERMFELAGYPNAKEAAASALRIETALTTARANAVRTTSVNIEDRFTRYTTEDLQKIFTGVNMKTILTSGGLKESPVYVTTSDEDGVFKDFAKLFTAENVPALSAYAAYRLLDTYRVRMGADFENTYSLATGAEEKTYTEEEIAYYARLAVRNDFSGYISEVYAKTYFDAESKAAVESMIHTFIDNYRGRIENLDWMSDATKKMAIKKLDTMVIKVGWRDTHDTFIEKLEVTGVADGGSLVGNLLALEKLKLENNAETQGKPADRTVWSKTAYEVNASYNPTLNDITFPAAILQAPFFSLDAAPEKNLSGVGWVISHEITHAFDTTGSQFDENGNLNDWWAPEDKAKFSELCEAVAAHYDGAEIAPGIVTDGTQTIGENTADLGALSCALEALRAVTDKPDYQLFFTNYATMSRKTSDRDGYKEFAGDVHSNACVRANQLVQNFGEFYEAFDVKPGDGMYVTPEQRVKIW